MCKKEEYKVRFRTLRTARRKPLQQLAQDMEGEAEEIAGPLPHSEQENRFMCLRGSTAMRSESEGIVKRMDLTVSETFELINAWDENEFRERLKNCRNGHVYELMS